MLKRLYLNLEIIGYSRAIGAMAVQPGATADHMVGLYTARDNVKKRLVELKAEQRAAKSTNDNNTSGTPASV